ncbi:hypothetical protein ACK3ZC_09500 [Aeromonas caviae]
MWERSYFCYFPDDDILVFQENLIGAKISDLEYILFKNCASGKGSFTFESIWRSGAVNALLNNKCTLKKVELSIALPRKFNISDMEIDNPWASRIIDMMSNVGMSRINLVFFGRASTKKSVAGYISDSVGESIKYMLEKFGTTDNAPRLKKAKLTPSRDGDPINLLDEKVKVVVRLACENGYENMNDVFNKMKIAKQSKNDELEIYRHVS